MIAYLQDFIAASSILSVLAASVVTAILTVRMRLFVSRVIARRESVLTLLRQIDAECARIADLGPISQVESIGSDNSVHIRALVGTYQDMCRRLTRRQAARLEVTWEQYKSQISEPDEQQIGGYRNYLTAHSRLQALAERVKPYG